MGTWSTDMLGGDLQLDVLADLEDIVGMPTYPTPDSPEDMQKMRVLLELLPHDMLDSPCLQGIGAPPVVAVVFMGVGAAMPQRLSDSARVDAQTELNTLNTESWGVERQVVLEKFLADLEKYEPGCPVPVEHKGLLSCF